MHVTRKEFIRLSLRSAFILGAGNSLRAIAAERVKLPAREDIQLRFAMVSDGHYGQAGTDYDFHHNNMIGWLNNETTRGVSFVMINGDLFHNDPTFLPQVKKKWQQLSMPYYVSHGNHDQIDAAGWEKTWNFPWHYTIEKEDIAFLVLNTADEKGNYTCPDLQWTAAQLESFASKKHLFIFMHITPFNWTRGGINCPELVSMFNKQNNLRAIFHGHDHDQDDVKENNGRHYFFDSHIAGDWGTAYRGYRVVEVLKNGSILTYQMNPKTEEKVNHLDLS